MSGALAEAKAQATGVMSSLQGELPNLRFGVAQIKDYGDNPVWRVEQSLTATQASVQSAINGLTAGGGGDSPEAYGTALYQAANDSAVGWTLGAKHLIVLVADEVPHDNDLNAGVPAVIVTQPSPWNTGSDPGPAGTGIDWQQELSAFSGAGYTLAYVLYHGVPHYLPYWNWWAELTGGAATESTSSTALGDVLISIITETATDGVPAAQTFGSGSGGGSGPAVGACKSSKPACDPSGMLVDPVNTATGSFFHDETDLRLPSAADVPFALVRSYNSADPLSGDLGQGWTYSYGASLLIAPNGDVTARAGDGQQLLFSKQPDGSFVDGAGGRSTLVLAGGVYSWQTRDLIVHTFDSSGKLTSVKDRNAQGVTLAYNAAGTIQSVTDAAGRVATFAFNASNLLSGVSLADGRSVSYAYTAGRLSSFTDARGRVWAYGYESGGRLATITDPLAHVQVANVYDTSSGRVTSQTDAVGKTTLFAWDTATQTATVTDPAGHVWKDVYSQNKLVKRIDGTNNTTEFSYDTDLNTSVVKAPDLSTTTMTYDAAGNLLVARAPASLGSVSKTFVVNASNDPVTVTDARGKVTSYTYDAAGNLLTTTQDGLLVATNTYDAQGRLLTVKDGNNNTTTSTYDAVGNLASLTDALGNKTTFTHDTAGRMLTRVEPKGNVVGCGCAPQFTSSWTYNAAGQVLTKTDQLGNVTTHVYDDAGNPVILTDARGKVTAFEYDAANRSKRTIAADGGVTEISYDSAGNKLSEKDPRNNVTTYGYDSANRLVSTTTATVAKTTFFYDVNGNLIKQVEPRGNVAGANPDQYATLFTYDAAGRVLTETDPLGNVTTRAYDAVGNEIELKDARLKSTLSQYDGLNRLIKVTAADGGVTEYTYDTAGNRLTEKDPRLNVRSHAYDAANRLVSTTSADPDGPGPQGPSIATYAYDVNGNQSSMVEPRGNVAGCACAAQYRWTNTFDRANRRLTATDPLGDATTTVYDAVGNTVSLTDANSHATAYTYDNVNRVKTVIAPDLGETTYTYDLAGNLATKTDAKGHTTSYAYDADNRRTGVTSPTNQVWTTAYDPASNVASTVDANGNATATAGDGTTAYAYDRAGRPIGVNYSNDSTPDVSYGVDAVGNRTSMADGDGTQARTYDPVNRLLTVTRSGTEIVPAATFSYVYDATGNVTKRTYPDGRFYDYTYDPVGRMSSVRENNVAASLVAYGYDVAGNQTSQSYPAANGYTESRVYDRAGRTTEVKHDRPAASTATTPMPPTSMLQQTNLTGAVGAIDEDPDAPDSDWMAAVSTIADTSVRVGFATPPYALAGAQTLKAHVRKEGGSANPTARIDLFNNGILVSTGPAVTVTSTTGQTIARTFDAGALSLGDGSGVEARLVGTKAGSGRQRATVAVGAIRWAAAFSLAQTLAKFTYALDPVGNPIQLVTPAGTTRYGYDTSDRISEVCYQATACTAPTSPFIRWTYDKVGNRLTEERPGATKAFTYNASDQMTAISGVGAFGYDQNGNQTSGGGWTTTYDLADRVTSSESASTVTPMSYRYDGDGIRTAVYGPSLMTSKTLQWDVNNELPLLVREHQATDSPPPPPPPPGNSSSQAPESGSSVIRNYSYGSRQLAETITETGGDFPSPAVTTTLYAHADRLGSVSSTTTTNGGPHSTYNYDPYGAARAGTAHFIGAKPSSTRFAGEYLDVPTGLYHLRARQYDPAIGRFTAVDPLEQQVGTPGASAYLYADGRPTVMVDPSGLRMRPVDGASATGFVLAPTVVDPYARWGLISRELSQVCTGADEPIDYCVFLLGEIGSSWERLDAQSEAYKCSRNRSLAYCPYNDWITKIAGPIERYGSAAAGFTVMYAGTCAVGALQGAAVSGNAAGAAAGCAVTVGIRVLRGEGGNVGAVATAADYALTVADVKKAAIKGLLGQRVPGIRESVRIANAQRNRIVSGR